MATRPDADAVTGEARSLALKFCENQVYVIHVNRDVMHSFATFGDELCDGRVIRSRLQQLQARIAERQHRGLYLLMLDGFLCGDGDSEGFVQSMGGRDAFDGDADVIELCFHDSDDTARSSWHARASTKPRSY
ncbi:MAG TPA: hypothetical protein VN678_11795 [Acidobacteriaceae bacterium]|nr:hypothetical protein [Acidobacteriaceae bacterium]